MRPTYDQLLRSARFLLAEGVAPELSDPGAKAKLDMVFSMLNELQGQLAPDQELLRNIVDKGCSIDADSHYSPDVSDWSGVQSFVENLTRSLGERIRNCEADLNLNSLADIFSLETDLWKFWILKEDKHGAADSGAIQIPDESKFSEYLNKVGVFEAEVSVLGIRPLSGGFSRRVFAVDAEKAGAPFEFIARCAVPGGLLEGGFAELEDEYHAMNTAHLQGLPCPQIYHYEPDPQWFGGDCLLMEFKPGKILGSALGSQDEIPQERLEQICTLLAQQHQLRWWDVPNPSSSAFWPKKDEVSLSGAVAQQLGALERYWRTNTDEPSALLEYSLNWLRQNAHRLSGLPVIVHGDVGFHNLLYDGDEISALIDWETAHIGCAAEDITYVLTSLKGQVTRRQFLSLYEEKGGHALDEATLNYCNVLNMARNTIVCHVGLAKYLQEPIAKAGLYTLGSQYRVHFQTALIEALL